MVKCPKCGNEASFIEKYKRHYCYECKEYLPISVSIVQDGKDISHEKKPVFSRRLLVRMIIITVVIGLLGVVVGGVAVYYNRGLLEDVFEGIGGEELPTNFIIDSVRCYSEDNITITGITTGSNDINLLLAAPSIVLLDSEGVVSTDEEPNLLTSGNITTGGSFMVSTDKFLLAQGNSYNVKLTIKELSQIGSCVAE